MCSNVILIPYVTHNTFNILSVGWIIDILKAKISRGDPLSLLQYVEQTALFQRLHIDCGQVDPICVIVYVQHISVALMLL